MLRITCKNYQTNKVEEENEEKSKEEEHKKCQEEREDVLEAKPLLDITHIFSDKNSSLEL